MVSKPQFKKGGHVSKIDSGITLLDALSLELEGHSVTHEPSNPVDHHQEEIVPGEVGLVLRKPYSLSTDYERRAKQLELDLTYIREDQRSPEKVKEFAALCEKSRLFKDIFWMELKDNLDLLGSGTIGIRQGWQVVKTTLSGSQSLLDWLRNLR